MTSALMGIIADRALMAMQRKRALLNKPPLPELRNSPFVARRAGASGDDPQYPSPATSSGSAVEAGRPAKPSTASDECDCAVCSSDLAGLVPCQRKAN